MWLAGMGFIIFSAATVPALGVYGPELFPTQLRARANAIITTISVMGSATGLVLAGQLDDRLDAAGTGIALLALGPVVVTVLVLTLYPETVDRELEDINPEDAALTARLDGFT
jgi:MFS family permease